MLLLKELCGYNKSFLIASAECKWECVKDNEWINIQSCSAYRDFSQYIKFLDARLDMEYDSVCLNVPFITEIISNVSLVLELSIKFINNVLNIISYHDLYTDNV